MEKIFVVGDSHIKRISRKRFNNSCEKTKTFQEAKIQELENYIVLHLNAQKPDVSVLHIGGNTNFKGINDINVKRITEDIINIGKKRANFGSDVFISSILIKRNIRLNSVIKKINNELQELCKKYNFNYISNHEIARNLLCDDGVHLSENGMDILAGSFINNINSTIFKRFFNSVNLNLQEHVHDHSQKKRKDSLETRAVLLIFSFELEISGVAVQNIHQNSEKL